MVRQCAWCLCLIDKKGGRISSAPLPKLYEASHGICHECGASWMDQVVEQDAQENSEAGMYRATQPVTNLIFELQHPQQEAPPGRRKRKRIHIV